jgi:hypothetical protein
LERAEPPLAQVPILPLRLFLGLALASDRQDVTLDRDLDIIGLDARQRRLDDEYFLGLGDVQRQRGRTILSQEAARPDDALPEQGVHRIVEADRLLEGIPTFRRHTRSSFPHIILVMRKLS